MSKSKQSTNNDNNCSSQTAQTTNDKPASKSKSLLRPKDYSPASSIFKAYSNGFFPSFTHKRLFLSILNLLDGNNEGNIDFNSLLEETKMHRSSVMQIIRHMVNFSILEVSLHSSQSIGQKRQSWAFIKIIRNPEAQEELPKSA